MVIAHRSPVDAWPGPVGFRCMVTVPVGVVVGVGHRRDDVSCRGFNASNGHRSLQRTTADR
jgi:hypothetical protein